MTEENAAQGRSHDGLRRAPAQVWPESVGKPPAEFRGQGRIHEDPGALEIPWGMQPRREKKMALEEGSTLAEKGEEIFVH